MGLVCDDVIRARMIVGLALRTAAAIATVGPLNIAIYPLKIAR
jgi:hypothetical protein